MNTWDEIEKLRKKVAELANRLSNLTIVCTNVCCISSLELREKNVKNGIYTIEQAFEIIKNEMKYANSQAILNGMCEGERLDLFCEQKSPPYTGNDLFPFSSYNEASIKK
jgi:hypothetical protein